MALQSKTFSIGDFAWGSSSNAYVLDLILTEESISQENNTSIVSYVLQLRSGGQNRFQATIASSLSLNGVSVDSGEANKYLDFNSTWVLLSGSTVVQHGDDGKLDMPFSASISTPYSNNQYAPPDMTLSGSWQLTNIDRETGIYAVSANIEETAIIQLDQKNESYTHSIAYQFGNLSGYISANGDPVSAEVKMTNKSLGFKVPAAFYSQIPENTWGTCVLTCRTYSGNTQIGKATTSEFTATAADYRCKPIVGGTVVDVNPKTRALTVNEKTLIYGCSTALCTMTVDVRNSGAEIRRKAIGGVSIDTESNTRTIENVEVADILFEAEDSRGYVGTYHPNDITLIPYTKLTNDAWASRPDAENNVTLYFSGNYYPGSFGAQENSLTLEYQLAGEEDYVPVNPTIKDDNTYEAEVLLPNMDYTKSHRINVKVSDKLTTIEIPVDTGKSIPVYNWGEDFFSFNVPVNFRGGIGGGNTAGLIAYPVGSIYMSVNATYPAAIFGGVWERLQDRFLLAASDTYALGSTGGEASVTLTPEKLPEHSHSEQLMVYGYDGWDEYTTDTYGVMFDYANKNGGAQYNASGATVNAAIVSAYTKTGNTGGNEAHNNMPPYLAVYMWKRIA